ncbi:MAG: hypothetical protein ACPGJV_10420 [Bacteriovoracaceae bacterium]
MNQVFTDSLNSTIQDSFGSGARVSVSRNVKNQADLDQYIDTVLVKVIEDTNYRFKNLLTDEQIL